MDIDPKFQKWATERKVGQRSDIGIPTRNANPTLKAGPKNSNGTVAKASHKVRTPVTKTAVGRPKGKVRAANNPSLSSRKG